ncbi:transmembrane protein [Aureococcus anophagefferens]|uniref:Transmembrane protein n=1 Tax=Aureococcus anophagefferens TaxID=44056 RepID=A0ABR1FW26_AURAN
MILALHERALEGCAPGLPARAAPAPARRARPARRVAARRGPPRDAMGRNLLEVLIPARFMLTMGHLVSLLMMIVYTKKENILAGLPRDPGKARYDDAKAEFEAA